MVQSLQQASDGTEDVNRNIDSVRLASDRAGVSASKLRDAANGLTSQVGKLRLEVREFLSSLRAA
jgi:methyl-accepting chemotaxis protein